MFAVFIVVAFLGGIAGLLALMSRLEPVEASMAVATRPSAAPVAPAEVAEQPRAA